MGIDRFLTPPLDCNPSCIGLHFGGSLDESTIPSITKERRWPVFRRLVHQVVLL